MTPEDILILVDEQDQILGYETKMEVHRSGKLHRAFSIILFNGKGEMLLQQRAAGKYHSPGLWTNTCCSHPLKDEDISLSLDRRLAFEMGITAPLTHLFAFRYRAEFENGLIEHELDHVYVGITEAQPQPNPDEVQAYRWVSPELIKNEMTTQPEQFTPWFNILMDEHYPTIEEYVSTVQS